jgi:adenylate kinase
MAISLVVSIFGPPAAGKTTLTMTLGNQPGRRVFRLREHVPQPTLAATATTADRLGWIDDFIVAAALYDYLEAVADDDQADTVLLDNFPGSAEQVDRLLVTLRALAPSSHIEPVELLAEPAVLKQRARTRRVCHRCEHDPICDPRMPAVPSPADPWLCAHCGNHLHPRRGDSPRLLKARTARYAQTSAGIRDAFTHAGVPITQLDSNDTAKRTANLLAPLLISRSAEL